MTSKPSLTNCPKAFACSAAMLSAVVILSGVGIDPIKVLLVKIVTLYAVEIEIL